MSKWKSFGSYLGTVLVGGLIIGGIGWAIMSFFPKTTGTVTTIGGILCLFLLYGAVDTMIKEFKKKPAPTVPVETKPTDASSQNG